MAPGDTALEWWRYAHHARGFTPLALSVGFSIKEILSLRLGRSSVGFSHGSAGDGDDRQGNGAYRVTTAGPSVPKPNRNSKQPRSGPAPILEMIVLNSLICYDVILYISLHIFLLIRSSS